MALKPMLRVGFAGTPEFAQVALQAVWEAGHSVCLVLTQPDRPAGRGMRCLSSPVKVWAEQQNLALYQPRGLRLEGRFGDDAASVRQALQAAELDVMVVAAYGLILPQWVLDVPRLGCLNIHASSLPRWRGAAPIHRAIEAGDAETGVTIMQMDAGLDTGPMLSGRTIKVALDETTGSLNDRLAALGGELIVQSLGAVSQGLLVAMPQASQGVSYAHKIDKAEALIDWSLPAGVLERRIRAFDPSPGAHTLWQGQILKLWRGQVLSTEVLALPGTVLALDAEGLVVQCALGAALRVTSLQRAGGKRLDAAIFFQGQLASDWVGQRLGEASASN